ncbi:alpha/beta hydrolase [Microcella daejeonensis]|uniref:alpha/beta fold hydrolase n=1 Tax=Microcella daejeonensis TaxID=2994971 RepID=UPI002270F2B5|nr:alpha/beta hydrolase [Microcella daejeonensis]WAB83496.1 alpha/beta hydrolase [Microcella daejeonensis]
MTSTEGTDPDAASAAPIVHASAELTPDSRVLLWQAGTPHTGRLLDPVLAIARALGRELVCVARPGYGGAPRRPGRSVAEGALDAAIALRRHDLRDVLVAGYSGGGPHALALAAAEPARIRAVVVAGCPAPYAGADEWFAGMVDPGALRAAVGGIDARGAHPEVWEPRSFTARDYTALEGEWRVLGQDAGDADALMDGGAVDDDVAFVTDWGFPLSAVAAPVTLAHGSADRIIPVAHAAMLAERLRDARLAIHDGDGHVSVLEHLREHLAAADRWEGPALGATLSP